VIYFCADDYGLSESVSARIKQCVVDGCLNKVSIFPNFGQFDLHKLSETKPVRTSLHLNLVEGLCMADADGMDLIVNKDGNFKHTFGGLLGLNFLCGKKLEAQVYREIKAQVLFWKNKQSDGAPFCIDSHQHTHMIPAVFRAMLRVLRDEGITPDYVRIPAEPILPYLKTPSLYFTYNAVGVIKQWLLKFLWMMNRHHAKNHNIPSAHFFGVLLSGEMDETRVRKLLPKYIRLAEKDGRDIEVLFHPGHADQLDAKNIVFGRFYRSENRKLEFDSVMKLSERSVL